MLLENVSVGALTAKNTTYYSSVGKCMSACK